MSSKFKKMFSWTIDVTEPQPVTLADLLVCPLLPCEDIDEDGPAGELVKALEMGQERGWVNHCECHWYHLLECQKSDCSIICMVFNIPQQEHEVICFVK